MDAYNDTGKFLNIDWKLPVSSEFRWDIWLRITASPANQSNIFRDLLKPNEKAANSGLLRQDGFSRDNLNGSLNILRCKSPIFAENVPF